MSTPAIFCPTAPARLLVDRRAFRWEVQNCPVCGKRHVHGGGALQDDPRQVLSHRAAHCFRPPENNGYILVDSDPARTVTLLEAVASLPTPGVCSL